MPATPDTATADRIAAELHRRTGHLQDRQDSGTLTEHIRTQVSGELIGLRGALGMALGHTVQQGADKAAKDYYQQWAYRQSNGPAGPGAAGEAPAPGTATVTVTIHAPDAANAARWANTIASTVRAEFGDTMRLDIDVTHPVGVERCDVLAVSGDQCRKRAGHRTPTSDNPHAFPQLHPEAG